MVFIDTSNSQAAIKAAHSGCPGRAVGAGDRQKQARVGGKCPSHRRLPPSARTSNKHCLVASAPHQTLTGTVLPKSRLPGSAAVHTCVLSAPPASDGIFFSIHLFCASSPGFEVVAYVSSVFKTGEEPKQPSSPPLRH